jgi:hypothetical protein
VSKLQKWQGEAAGDLLSDHNLQKELELHFVSSPLSHRVWTSCAFSGVGGHSIFPLSIQKDGGGPYWTDCLSGPYYEERRVQDARLMGYLQTLWYRDKDRFELGLHPRHDQPGPNSALLPQPIPPMARLVILGGRDSRQYAPIRLRPSPRIDRLPVGPKQGRGGA